MKITPQPVYDFQFNKDTKSLIKELKSIRSDLKIKIKRLDLVIDLFENNSNEKAYDVLIELINEELCLEIKNVFQKTN